MVHHSAALVHESGDGALPEAVVSGRLDALPSRLQALLLYAIALTVSPGDVTRDEVQQLVDLDLSARDVIDANQVVAYFNYVNRVAEGLGVELEDEWPVQSRVPRTYALREWFVRRSSRTPR